MKLKPTIVIITGLSGSGKTVALRALEDSGFFVLITFLSRLLIYLYPGCQRKAI